MSTLKVNKLRDTAGSADAITLDPNGGAVLAGVTTVTSVKVGAAVTISESGIDASGIGITCANINGTQIGGRRNIIINGAMQVAQRGTSSTPGNSTSVYTLDRMESSMSHDGALTITQSSTAPDGFANSLKVDVTTADTSLASGQYAQIMYKVEAQDLQQLAFGTSGAKDSVLSFYVRSNKTGNYGVALLQNDNGSKLISFQYTINSANTWERKAFLIPGDTAGVINDDNGRGFDIHIGLAAGTDYTDGSLQSSFTAFNDGNLYAGQAVNLLDSTSNEWYITGLQMEVGSQATAFEHRSVGDELALCQRYYFRLENDASTTCHLGTMQYYGGSQFFGFLMNLPVEMRAIPTATLSGSGKPWKASGNANGSFTSLALNKNSKTSLSTNGSSTSISDGVAGNATVITLLQSSYIDADAEL